MERLRHRACRLVLVGTLAGSAGAHAQVPASSVADCHGIASSAERLACYDAVTGRAAAARKAGEQSARPAATPSGAPTTRPAATGGADAMARAVAKEGAGNAATSMIDAAWDFDPASPAFDVRFYRANYLLFARYTNDVNTAPFTPVYQALDQPPEALDSTEAKFQLSFKTRLCTTDDRRWGVWIGYTQQSQWQVYNEDISRPFRETNYMPDAFLSFRPGVDLGGGFHWNLLNAGYVHQSNGRTDVLSRSWDRVYAELGVERESFALFGKFWYPFNDEDDNPDIADYLGYGEISALYRWRNHSLSAAVRGNTRTGKGAVQFNWTSPPLLGALRGYVQFFSGYGESLIDYNWKQTTIGAGIAFNDGL